MPDDRDFEESRLKGHEPLLAKQSEGGAAGKSTGLLGGQRRGMLLILFFCNCCLYINRANISVAIVYMYKDKGACRLHTSTARVLTPADGYEAYTPMHGHAGKYDEHKKMQCGGNILPADTYDDTDLDNCKSLCSKNKHCTCLDFKDANKNKESALILSAFYWVSVKCVLSTRQRSLTFACRLRVTCSARSRQAGWQADMGASGC